VLITCLRHATAEEHTNSVTDAQRSLVKKGEAQVLRVAEFCRKNALSPVVLFSSPLKRAEQTAALFQIYLPDCSAVQLVDWLTLGSKPEIIVAALRDLEKRNVNDVWLVGHEPDLSRLIGYLLNVSAERMAIKKASLTRMDVDFSDLSHARLLWSIPCALMH
jgi:phosphohistidine phosphatase SixA